MTEKKLIDRMTPAERNKLRKRLTRLALKLQKIRERNERPTYVERVQGEIVEPIKLIAEFVFALHGLGKPKIVVVRPEPEKNSHKRRLKYRTIKNPPKTSPRVRLADVRKVAKGLGAERITDQVKIAEMKKKAYLRRPK